MRICGTDTQFVSQHRDRWLPCRHGNELCLSTGTDGCRVGMAVSCVSAQGPVAAV
jgi:hypothetical protein